MRTWTRRMLSGGIAALVLAVAVGAASGNRLEFSSGQFRAVWTERTPARFELGSGTGVISCLLTLEGSFHSRTISKVVRSLIGYITRASIVPACTGGTLNMTTETLPWHIRYDSFTGTLPRISTIRFQFVGYSMWLTWFQTRCVYTSTAERPVYGIRYSEATGPFGEFIPSRFDLEGSMTTPTMGCPPSITMLENSGSLFVPGTTTAITATLVL